MSDKNVWTMLKTGSLTNKSHGAEVCSISHSVSYLEPRFVLPYTIEPSKADIHRSLLFDSFVVN